MRRLIAALFVAVATCWSAKPAFAGFFGGGYDNPTAGTVTALAGESSTSPASYSSPAAASQPDPCQFQWISGSDLAGPGGQTNGAWAFLIAGPPSCVAGLTQGIFGAFPGYWFPDATPAGAAPPPQQLASLTLSSASAGGPGVQTWPPSANGETNFPTWVHVSSGWSPITATATDAGVTVTVTATPTTMTVATVDSTDGGSTYEPVSLTCPGPGSAYDPNQPYDSQHSDCSVTWSWPSADYGSGANYGTYPLTVSVTYSVSWTATGPGGGTGTLAPITRSTTLEYRVGEVEALGS